jgi:lipopolysaccharide export system permease protein
MKILDRYLLKQFLLTIGFGLVAFTMIFVVIDMMENLDDFIDMNVTADIILHYYFVFTPEIIRLITPVAVLFAALFTAGKAANLSELTAIKASGVGLYRFMAPFVIAALFISLLSIYFGGYLVPMANETKIYIERTYLKKGINFAGSNIFFQDSKTRIVNISYFDISQNFANRVSIQEFQEGDPTAMISRVDANRLVYDSTGNSWVAYDAIKRIFHETNQTVEYQKELPIKNVSFTPQNLIKKQQKPEEMNLEELKELVESQRNAGNDPTSTLIEYYSRYSFAAASFVVVLFGLPIAAGRRRGGLAVQIGINILVTFIYLVFMKISQAFGKNGALDPFLTAWMANFIFFGAAIINLIRVKQ